jgi:hypothetical protein
MEDFNELEWINQFYNNEIVLQDDAFNHVKNFSFFWNMFERFACGRFATIRSINLFVDKLDQLHLISNELVNSYLEYFIDRYSIGNNQFDIQGLKFRPNQNGEKNFVIQVLNGQRISNPEKLKALLYIILRFRNNLFHGEKQISRLDTQIDNFIRANHLLSRLLDLMKLNHLITF